MDKIDLLHTVSKLQQARLQKGFTLKDVATIADVSIRAIKKYEAGEQLPNRSVYNKLAAIFDWEVWH